MTVSHANSEARQTRRERAVDEIYRRTTNAVSMRVRGQIQGLLRDFELQEPGLVHVPLWRSEWRSESDGLFVEQPRRSVTLGSVGFEL